MAATWRVWLTPKARPELQSSRLAYRCTLPPRCADRRLGGVMGEGPKASGWRANFCRFMAVFRSMKRGRKHAACSAFIVEKHAHQVVAKIVKISAFQFSGRE